jgi:peptidoglycan/xylan/chitin deacetylase (PgdA/CDA1 family)
VNASCVLTFHRVADAAADHDVAWDSFRALVGRIAAADARVAPELEPPGAGRPGPVVLTFDDGTADHLRAARELAAHGLAGVFFVPAASIGEPGHLDAVELRELAALGQVVGSHAFHHEPLGRLDREALTAEVVRSRDLLAEALGAEIRYFAPPGGVSNPFLAEELERHGFTASRSMRWGLYRTAAERWSIPCLPVTSFTLGRGWIDAALARRTLPPAMRSTGRLKEALPPVLRMRLRHAVHARRGRTA